MQTYEDKANGQLHDEAETDIETATARRQAVINHINEKRQENQKANAIARLKAFANAYSSKGGTIGDYEAAINEAADTEVDNTEKK